MNNERGDELGGPALFVAIAAFLLAVAVGVVAGCDIKGVEDDIEQIHLEATIEAGAEEGR